MSVPELLPRNWIRDGGRIVAGVGGVVASLYVRPFLIGWTVIAVNIVIGAAAGLAITGLFRASWRRSGITAAALGIGYAIAQSTLV